MEREGGNQWIVYYVQRLWIKRCQKETSLSLAWCHDQFNTRTACLPVLTHRLMVFLALTSFKLLFIASIFLAFDWFSLILWGTNCIIFLHPFVRAWGNTKDTFLTRMTCATNRFWSLQCSSKPVTPCRRPTTWLWLPSGTSRYLVKQVQITSSRINEALSCNLVSSLPHSS